jgi:hypothetical protein
VRVNITQQAAQELRARGVRAFLVQPGQPHEEYSGPEWSEDEAILAPPQRWLLLPVAVESFDHVPESVAERVCDLGGFKAMITSSTGQETLSIELVNGAIRVREVDDA